MGYVGAGDMHASSYVPCTAFQFRVESVSYANVTTPKLRLYSKKLSGSCPTSLGSGDFLPCGTRYTDLGVISITSWPGTHAFTLPSPDANLGKGGMTKFVLVDASVYSGDGSVDFTIDTNEATQSSDRPKLLIE